MKKLNTLKYKTQDSQKLITILRADQHLPKQSYAVSVVSEGTARKSTFNNITNQFSATTWKNNETGKSQSTESVSNQEISLEKKI